MITPVLPLAYLMMNAAPSLAISSLVALIVCFFVGRAAWRAIIGKPAVPKTPARADETKPENPAA